MGRLGPSAVASRTGPKTAHAAPAVVRRLPGAHARRCARPGPGQLSIAPKLPGAQPVLGAR